MPPYSHDAPVLFSALKKALLWAALKSTFVQKVVSQRHDSRVAILITRGNTERGYVNYPVLSSVLIAQRA